MVSNKTFQISPEEEAFSIIVRNCFSCDKKKHFPSLSAALPSLSPWLCASTWCDGGIRPRRGRGRFFRTKHTEHTPGIDGRSLRSGRKENGAVGATVGWGVKTNMGWIFEGNSRECHLVLPSSTLKEISFEADCATNGHGLSMRPRLAAEMNSSHWSPFRSLMDLWTGIHC